MAVVGVIPAAGFATRLQPLVGSKEMLDVGGRPVVDYVVERMRAASAGEIRVVTRSDKTDLTEHARELGLTTIEAQPPTLADSILAGVDDLAQDDVVLLGFPDSIWEPPSGYAMLCEALTAEVDAALGVFRSTEPERGDVVELDGDRVVAVHVKPADPPGDLIWGAAVAAAGAFRRLNGHSNPGELFDELARNGGVQAVRFPGQFLDIGTKEAVAHARELLG
jgi:NDP-sugar pyrophosphorylase family protein